MANLVPLDQAQVPAFLKSRKVNNDSFLAALPQGGGFPIIGLKGTRFVVKADGGEVVLPSTEIAVVLIAGKNSLEKAWYASKYDPNQSEVKAPDCFSRDGVRPDPSSTRPQAQSCAGCPQNQFGSGKDAAGNPSKGKACSDKKLLAIFANKGVYGFNVPPASLNAFTHYAKETSCKDIDLATCITIIGFDPNFTYPVLTFNFGGFLAKEQVDMIDKLKGTQEVLDIVGGVAAPAQVAPITASTPSSEPEPKEAQVGSDPFAEVVAPTAKSAKENPRKETPKKKKHEDPPIEGDADLAALAAQLGVTLDE